MPRRHGACLVEVNPDTTSLSGSADFQLRGKAGAFMPELLNCLDHALN